MTDLEHRVFNVLFLCTGNSARSLMAEALLNMHGKGHFKAYSGGSRPKGSVHPFAIDLLKHEGVPTEGLRSKSWDEFASPDAPEMDFIFTVCDDAAKEECPTWPGAPMSAHWGVPDPALAHGNDAEMHVAFAEAFRMLETRIKIFVSLPVASLDHMALHARLSEIGTHRHG